jgi:hypothetical protein
MKDAKGFSGFMKNTLPGPSIIQSVSKSPLILRPTSKKKYEMGMQGQHILRTVPIK